MLRILAISALLVTMTPLVAAHGPCEHGADLAIGVSVGDDEVTGFYLGADNHLYQETNNHHGLQIAGGSCETDDGRTASWAADTLLL